MKNLHEEELRRLRKESEETNARIQQMVDDMKAEVRESIEHSGLELQNATDTTLSKLEKIRRNMDGMITRTELYMLIPITFCALGLVVVGIALFV